MFIESGMIVFAYLLGSFSSAVIVCRIMGLPDPRKYGSNNPGTTNVLRIGGKKAAVLTLFLDIFKGTAAVFIAKMLTTSPSILAGVTIAVFLGHLYPLFFKFKGGKGVATAFGALLALSWQTCLASLAGWVLIIFLFRYSSLASLISAVLLPSFLLWFSGEKYYVVMGFVIASLIIWRHRGNIKRLLRGEESKIGQSKLS
jgi:glycerol-3-phosphate acyltransferase PlsY